LMVKVGQMAIKDRARLRQQCKLKGSFDAAST
jgi:hypothetical protein